MSREQVKAFRVLSVKDRVLIVQSPKRYTDYSGRFTILLDVWTMIGKCKADLFRDSTIETKRNTRLLVESNRLNRRHALLKSLTTGH